MGADSVTEITMVYESDNFIWILQEDPRDLDPSLPYELSRILKSSGIPWKVARARLAVKRDAVARIHPSAKDIQNEEVMLSIPPYHARALVEKGYVRVGKGRT